MSPARLDVLRQTRNYPGNGIKFQVFSLSLNWAKIWTTRREQSVDTASERWRDVLSGKINIWSTLSQHLLTKSIKNRIIFIIVKIRLFSLFSGIFKIKNRFSQQVLTWCWPIFFYPSETRSSCQNSKILIISQKLTILGSTSDPPPKSRFGGGVWNLKPG